MAVLHLPTPCVIAKVDGADMYGIPKYATKVTVTRCAVIKLAARRMKTTVRVDSSGTRGHAEEIVAESKLLMKRTENIDLGDRISVNALRLKVIAITPRFDAFGVIDHLEVEGEIE